jgi:hypothetical protein
MRFTARGVVQFIALLAWIACLLIALFNASCSHIAVNPSNPQWREDQQTCESFVGSYRNHVDGEPVAVWCSRPENSAMVKAELWKLCELISDFNAVESALLNLLSEVREMEDDGR